MKQLAIATALIAAVGCAGQGPDSELDYSDVDDSLSEFSYARNITKIVQMDEVSADEIIDVTDNERGKGLVVSAPLFVLGAPEQGSMNISIRTDEVLGFVTNSDMQFILVSQDDAGGWNELVGIPLRSENDEQRIAVAFDSIEFDAENGMLMGEGDDGSVSVAAPDFPSRVGVFPIPASTWGDIRGDYEFQLNAECGGEACTAPARDIPGDEKDPEVPDLDDRVRTDKSIQAAPPAQSMRL